MEKLKITVIGCGWLGLPLCHLLSAHSHEIITTTTTAKKLQQLKLKFDAHIFNIHLY